MASSISDYKHTQSSKRELSPSSPSITGIAKRTRLDTLFDTSTQEEQVSGLAIGDDHQSSLGAQTPTFENRMRSFAEPGSGGYDRTPTRDPQAQMTTASMAHALLGIQDDMLDGIDEDDEDDEDDDEYFNDAIGLDEKPYRRSLYSELVTSSNLPDEEDRRKSNLISSALFENEDEDEDHYDEEGTTDFENKTTLPLSRSFAQRQHQSNFDEEVDRLFSSHNPADEPEFVLSSAAKLSILQQQHQHGPLWHTDKPHFLTDDYFQHHGPQDRSIPVDDRSPHTASIASYFDSQFERLGVMGSGEFARVLKARCITTNELYAVKKSRNSFTGWDDRWLQLTEVDHLRSVKESEHCVKMVNAWEEKGYLYIQLELCSGGR